MRPSLKSAIQLHPRLFGLSLVLGLVFAWVAPSPARMLIARSRPVGQFGEGSADFRDPLGIALLDEDNYWVSDWKLGLVRIFNREGGRIRTLDPEEPFAGPIGLDLDAAGNLFVVENQAGRIRKIAPSGEELGRIGQVGSEPGELRYPRGIAVSAEGQVFVADFGNRRIQIYDADLTQPLGEVVHLDPKSGQPARPRGVAIDPKGRLWAVYSETHEVVRFDASLQAELKFGSHGRRAGQFLSPRYLAFDGRGSVFVTDFDLHRIQQFDEYGNLLYSYGARGSAPGQFHGPEGIEITPRGDMVIADSKNYRIQILELNANDAHRNQAREALEAGDWETALDFAEQVLKRVPGDFESVKMVEGIYLEQAKEAEEAGRLDRALSMHSRLQRHSPGHLESHRAVRRLFWMRARPMLYALSLLAGGIFSALLVLVLGFRWIQDEWRRRPGDRAQAASDPQAAPWDFAPGGTSGGGEG